MRGLQSLALILFLASLAGAQACGYTFLTVYVTDSDDRPIKTAEIKTFDGNFVEVDRLHYPQNDDTSDRFRKNLAWVEAKQAYYGSEGMCGGHRAVGLSILAKGFETLNSLIDIPLGWTSYSIKLQKKGIRKYADVKKLAHFRGEVIDDNKGVIPSARIEITDERGQRFRIESNEDGRFDVDLPVGNYSIQISQPGFRKLTIINFRIEDSDTIFLDLQLTLRGCDDCDGDILGENDGAARKEIILDYQIIKRKTNN